MILIISCSETKPYYETPINNWLSKNLNDYSSYKPIEFTVLSSNKDLFTHIDILKLQLIVQRKVKIEQDLIREFKKVDGVDLNQISNISDNSQNLAKFNSKSDYSIILVDSVNNLLDKEYEIQANKIEDALKGDLLDLYVQFEGVSNRYQVELENVNRQLLVLGTDINNYDSDLKNGLFISHKFRGNNSFGALVINSVLFKLNYEKRKVLKAFSIK